MGSSSSTMSPGTAKASSTSTAGKTDGKLSEELRQTMTKKGAMFVQSELSEKLKDMSKIIESFNSNDPTEIKRYIETLSRTLASNTGSQQFSLSPDVMTALDSIHQVLIRSLDQQRLSPEDQKKALRDMSFDTIYATLTKQSADEIKTKKDEIYSSLRLETNDPLKTNIEPIFDTITKLKVKYKFFEYKYIELNMFMIMYIQTSYDVLQDFIKNTIAFNQLKEENRDNLINEAFASLNNVFASADLASTPADEKNLKDIMNKVKQNIKEKDEEMNKKLDKIIKVSQGEMTGFVEALSKTTQSALRTELNKPQQTAGRKNQAFFDLNAS